MLGWQSGKHSSSTAAQLPAAGRPVDATVVGSVIVRRSSVDRARQPLWHWVARWWSEVRLRLLERRFRRISNRGRTSDRWWPLVLDVVNYCNAMMIDGHFKPQEIYPPAMQAYYADFYLAQVNNGGHSQFVGNAGGKLPIVIGEARKGLAAMGATKHLALLEKAAAWVAANPEEAKRQTGFEGGRADELDALDALFYAAERIKGMAELSARWILSWPELQVVDDADYRAAMTAAVGVSNRRMGSTGRSLDVRLAELLRAKATDVTRVGIGLACGAVDRIPHSVGTSPYTEIDGTPALFVGTGGRTFCFCAVEEKRIAIYAGTLSPGSPTPLPAPTGDRTRDARERPNGGMPQPGQMLAEISLELAEATVALAARDHLGSAISLLLANAAIRNSDVFLSAAGIQPQLETTNWVVIVGSQILEAVQSPSQTVLRDSKTKAIVSTVEANEISGFAEEA